MSLSDQMLSAGCALHVESVHGETIRVLSGQDAGLSFTAVKETESDLVMDAELGPDPRAKRVLRFREFFAPRLKSQDVIQTEDGRKWHAALQPQGGYLTTDFELLEIVAGKDK